MPKNEQVTVPLTAIQRAFVKRVAEEESTSEAAIIRRLVTEAARRNGALEDLQPLPVRPHIRNADELADARGKLAQLEAERDQLLVKRRRLKLQFSLMDDERLRFLLAEIPTFGREVRLAELMLEVTP